MVRLLDARKPLARILAGVVAATALTAPLAAQKPGSPAPPTSTYWVYVGAESADLIQRIRFNADGAVVEKTTAVGQTPVEMEGPHGLAISRDGKWLHMTTGHGSPDGKYWRYALGPDTLASPGIFLGYFPATLDVTPDGLYAFVVNFNLYGAMIPSSVSVVYTPTSTEVARVTTCTMPHGSRIDATGRWQYSACMMDDQVVEIDTRTFAIARRFSVSKESEGPIDTAAAAGHQHEHTAGQPMPPASCSPTWAQPSATGARIYVACNKRDEILEINRDRWTVTRRFPTGRGPYNLAATPDGKLLVASLKQGGAVQIFDLASGKSVMEMKSSTTVTHGVAISPDSRYAFVSNEGVGAEPGKVDVYDLVALTRVASVEVGQQAGGIAFWRMEAGKRDSGEAGK